MSPWDYKKRDRAVFNGVSKVISELLWFCTTSLSDCFEVLGPLFQPIRSETNRGSRVHIFLRSVSATCNYFEFWLVFWIVSALLIGQRNYFGFGCMKLDWNSLYMALKKHKNLIDFPNLCDNLSFSKIPRLGQSQYKVQYKHTSTSSSWPDSFLMGLLCWNKFPAETRQQIYFLITLMTASKQYSSDVLF